MAHICTLGRSSCHSCYVGDRDCGHWSGLNGVLVSNLCSNVRLWSGLVFVSLHPGHRVALFKVAVQFVFVQQGNVMAELWEPGCLQLTAVQVLFCPSPSSPHSLFWFMVYQALFNYSWSPTYGVCGGPILTTHIWIARISIVILMLDHLKSPLWRSKAFKYYPVHTIKLQYFQGLYVIYIIDVQGSTMNMIL